MSLMRVRELMTEDPFTLDAAEDFVSADQIMKLKHVRHLPVVEGRKLIGLVTQRDLMRAQAKLLMEAAKITDDEEHVISVTARDFMTKKGLATCGPATPADDAARLMLERKIGCVLVTDGDDLVGILTEADLVEWAIEMMAKERLEHSPKSTPPEPDGL